MRYLPAFPLSFLLVPRHIKITHLILLVVMGKQYHPPATSYHDQ